jgi:6-pyruvoyltetrahydropterin/6-carboxytetrahydropterin synthase
VRAFLSQTFLFDAAHSLARSVPLPDYEASARIHGHTYTAEVTVVGDLKDGMIFLPKTKGLRARELDVLFLRSAIGSVRAVLDHRLLDEVEGLGRPTMENLCVYIGEAIRACGLPVASVRVSRQTGDAARVEW